ncbi:MAG: type II 3-dehydroquinate dehydratase [Verrucomicrobia bacterium]|jgi:3-dehydroquinate dehydratase-2|nr:type II 3-dehydroquinate dehydratase [Verrucomicrobiota bacterium]
MKTVAILNGPNLHRLGKREEDHYGSFTFEELLARLQEAAAAKGAALLPFQSNHEGDLIEKIHAWSDDGITRGIINPGGLTHTSVSLRDAIAASSIRFVEVHLSHLHQREEFRHHSLTAPVCAGQISGLGAESYLLALDYLLREG